MDSTYINVEQNTHPLWSWKLQQIGHTWSWGVNDPASDCVNNSSHTVCLIWLLLPLRSAICHRRRKRGTKSGSNAFTWGVPLWQCRAACERILTEEGNAKLHDKANNWEERWTGSSLDFASQSLSLLHPHHRKLRIASLQNEFCKQY